MNRETINFGLDINKAIYNLIYYQGGNLDKGIIEAIQNLLDQEQNSIIDITIKYNRKKLIQSIEIFGNGMGMTEDIIKNDFRTFCQTSKSEHKIGKFAVGRGQIFRYGKTTYSTKKHKIVVDVKKKGFSFELSELDEEIEDGTLVTIIPYKTNHEFEMVYDSLRYKFFIPKREIVLNKEDINIYHKEMNVQNVNTPLANYSIIDSINDKSMVFLKGIYITDIKVKPHFIINSSNLDVNMARNEIHRNKKYNDLVSVLRREYIVNKILNHDRSKRFEITDVVLYDLLKDKELGFNTIRDLKFIKTLDGGYISPNKIGNICASKFGLSQTYFKIISKNELLPIIEGSNMINNLLRRNKIQVLIDSNIKGTVVYHKIDEIMHGKIIVLEDDSSWEKHGEEYKRKYKKYIDLFNYNGFRNKRKIRFVKGGTFLGRTHKGLIEINVDRIIGNDDEVIIPQLLRLIIHEYAHDKHDDNSHGSEFNEKFRKLMENNKIFFELMRISNLEM